MTPEQFNERVLEALRTVPRARMVQALADISQDIGAFQERMDACQALRRQIQQQTQPRSL